MPLFLTSLFLILLFSVTCFANNKNVVKDTNIIIKIDYPEITEREGKGLQIPIPLLGHPRLFLTTNDLPVLLEKRNSPYLRKSWEKIAEAATYKTNGFLNTSISSNQDITIRNAIEAKAFLFLFSKDTSTARDAIVALLHFYATLNIDMAKPDVCREIGRHIVTGSLVYDWCYPLLTTSEKKKLIGRMETFATQLEVQWPKMVQSSVTGHGVEAQLSRDMLSCGIATYNEKPEIYNRVAGRILAEFIPVRRFFYPASYHHQGSSYGGYRAFWDMNATFLFDKIGYPNLFGTDQAKVPYYFIYNRRPDGQTFRNGDDFNELFNPFTKYWNFTRSMHASIGSYFKDPILIAEAIKQSDLDAKEKSDYLLDFLMYDFNVPLTKTKASLPLTTYFKAPFGAMIARTSWDDGLQAPTVVAEMKVGVYNFINHQHLDAGSFQIYYKGPLTVNSGIYQGKNGAYGSEHFRNYYQRSISQNTMLVYDPNEKFVWGNRQVINDGGQHIINHANEASTLQDILSKDYKTGEVLAQAFGPDSIKPEFSYLKGYITAAYSNKVKNFTRSFVFLNFNNSNIPAALIVFDNITSSNPNFKKYWLLHSVEEPVVNGKTTTITRTEKGYDGKMINTTLLPTQNNLVIDKVGGLGNEYNVFGTNFPQSLNNPAISSVDSATWRVQVSPKLPATSNLFLNVMQVMDSKTNIASTDLPKNIETKEFTGTLIADRMVLFSKNKNAVNSSFKLSIKAIGNVKVLIVDVEKADWKITSLTDKNFYKEVANDQQLLYFTIKAGDYVISKK